MGNEFLFSVIIPAYNVEKYIREAIDSIINQSLGFENIQLIVVNDGSTDNTATICKEYESQYPQNFLYIGKENGGVGSARNLGIKYAKGQYVNFLDADDKWSLNAFEHAWEFFKRNPDIKLASARMKFFERDKGNHPLNYKYSKTDRVVNIWDDYDCVQHHSACVFFNKALFDIYSYNETFSVSEDILLLNQILLDVENHGLLSEATYHYRKRNDMTSALDFNESAIELYLNSLDVFIKNMEASKEKYGSVIKYVQYSCAWDLIHKLNIDKNNEKEEFAKYITKLRQILENIEPYIIINIKRNAIERKLLLIALKYGKALRDIYDGIYYDNGGYYISPMDIDISNLVRPEYLGKFKIKTISIAHKNIKIAGNIDPVRLNKNKLEAFLIINNNRYKLNTRQETASISSTIAGDTYGEITFDIELPIKSFKCIFYAECKIANGPGFKSRMFFGQSVPIDQKFPDISYAIRDNYLLIARNQGFEIRKILCESLEQRYREKLYLREIKNNKTGLKASKFRHKTITYKRQKNSDELWVIGFSFLQLTNDDKSLLTKVIELSRKNRLTFVIHKEFNNYKCLGKFGTVVPYGTDAHMEALLQASKVLFLTGEDNYEIYKPFGGQYRYLKGLLDAKLLSISSDITINELVELLQKIDK